jgi:hypothetical protein
MTSRSLSRCTAQNFLTKFSYGTLGIYQIHVLVLHPLSFVSSVLSDFALRLYSYKSTWEGEPKTARSKSVITRSRWHLVAAEMW